MRRLLVLSLMVVTVGGLFGTSAASAATTHCPDHTTETKFEGAGTFQVDGITVTVMGRTVTFTDANGDPVVVEFCVKAGPSDSGVQTGSSFTVNWLNNGGNRPAISYVVFYGAEEPPCDPYADPYCNGGAS